MRLRIRDLVWLSVCLGRATELHLGYTDGVEHGGHVVGVRLASHLLNDPPQNLVPKVGVSMSRTCKISLYLNSSYHGIHPGLIYQIYDRGL